MQISLTQRHLAVLFMVVEQTLVGLYKVYWYFTYVVTSKK